MKATILSFFCKAVTILSLASGLTLANTDGKGFKDAVVIINNENT